MITFHRIAVVPAAVVLLGSAMPSVLESTDLKIRTIQQNSGTPVAMNPRLEERVVYLEGKRRRTEERREQRNSLWPGGPQVTFYEPHGALIESCDGDTKKAFSLNLDNRTFTPIEMSRRLTPEEIKAFQAPIPPKAEPTRPTVLHETTTMDTGERKQAFGYYIDLDTRISCDPPRKELGEGTTYAAVSVVIGTSGQTTGPISASNPSLVRTTYIGKPETGFPIWRRTTIRNSVSTRAGNSEQVSVMETEVTELSANPLDPNLFEVPTNFRSVLSPQALLGLRVAWWARWLAWGHYYWLRFRKRI
ncbi:MAG: hypothetical protein DMG31_14255 [Acidobacteria bacterium]|nr:MAG: hypothetical protein DMG31_14255 [Acidobacteriota bacterium]